MQRTQIIALGLGGLLGALITTTFLLPTFAEEHEHNASHQITQPDEEYHVHADFLIYLRDSRIDLGEDVYMTTATQELHPEAHLHDGNGEVKHLHQAGVTFAEFLNSLGLQLTNECLIYDGEDFCTNTEEQLRLFVNNEEYEGSLTDFEITDEDRLLVYYGADDPDTITDLMNEVKNDACYYSGTCPERGVAPPESCGLTCDL